MSLRICTIGCGGMAQTGHGPSYRRYVAEHPGTELAACCDLSAERAESFRQTFGFARAYTDFREMLGKEKPDAVCLLVNVDYLCAMTCEILEAGLPLLLEKPPGLNLAEATRMAETAARRSVPHAVAFNRRSAPMIGLLRDTVSSLGTSAQRYHYELLRVNRLDLNFSTTAIHGIDTLRFISGADYKRVDFHYQELPGIGSGVCNVSMECELSSGATASLMFMPVTGRVAEAARVFAHDHYIEFTLPDNDSPGALRHYERRRLAREICGTGLSDGDQLFISAGFYGENCDFFEAVRTGRPPANSLPTTLQSVSVAEHYRRRAPVFLG